MAVPQLRRDCDCCRDENSATKEQYCNSGSSVKPLSVVKRTARYTAVGAICAVAHNIVMILGGLAGGHYIPLSFVSFGLVTPLGYLLHSFFTFQARPSSRNFLRFASGVAAGLPLYFIVMATLCSGVGLAIAWSAPITTAALYLWNYAAAHWALRRRLPLL